MRENFRYGDDDPLQWPQPLPKRYQYLAAVPIVTSTSKDPPAIMAWNPDRHAFVADRGAMVSGIGRLNNDDYANLDTPCRRIISRAQRDAVKILLNEVAEDASEYTDLLHHLLFRLKNISTGLGSMRFCVRSVQRVYLYLRALLDWHEIFLPRLNKIAPHDVSIPPPPLTLTVGAFTMSTTYGDMLRRMGIRVWFVRPFSELRNARIRHLAIVANPRSIVNIERSCYDDRCIHRGTNTATTMYTAFVNYIHSHLRYPNPFGNVKLPYQPTIAQASSLSSWDPSPALPSPSISRSASSSSASSASLSSHRLSSSSMRANKYTPCTFPLVEKTFVY